MTKTTERLLAAVRLQEQDCDICPSQVFCSRDGSTDIRQSVRHRLNADCHRLYRQQADCLSPGADMTDRQTVQTDCLSPGADMLPTDRENTCSPQSAMEQKVASLLKDYTLSSLLADPCKTRGWSTNIFLSFIYQIYTICRYILLIS